MRKQRTPRKGVKAAARNSVDPPSFSPRLHVPSLESLDEISAWLGTFRERLRLAQEHDRADVVAIVEELEVHYRRRRAELS